jgi:hypothetical protein
MHPLFCPCGAVKGDSAALASSRLMQSNSIRVCPAWVSAAASWTSTVTNWNFRLRRQCRRNGKPRGIVKIKYGGQS